MGVFGPVGEDREGEINMDAKVRTYFQPSVTRLKVSREDGKEGPGWTASIHILVVQHEAELHRPIKLCLGSFSDMWPATQTTK